MTPQQQAFIDRVTPGALASERTHGVPAAVTIAQAILESGWGTSGLATRANALFGIKAGGGWSGRTYSAQTGEVYDGVPTTVTATFRAYDSWDESIEDHAAFLRSRSWYADAFATSTPDDFVRALVNPGEPAYATDPDYARKVIGLMDAYGLREVGRDHSVDTRQVRADLDALATKAEELRAALAEIGKILAQLTT